MGVTPPVRIETSSAAVTEGQTLDLNCMVAGQGHPHVTWYRRGGALPPNSQVGLKELVSLCRAQPRILSSPRSRC